ncbi:general secretion pathway protein GspK [Thermodesulfobacteriota bacterium]
MRRPRERGIALILTLLIIVLLTTMVVELNYVSRIELNVTTNFRDDLKAYYVAEAGQTFWISFLQMEAQISAAMGQLAAFSQGGGTGSPGGTDQSSGQGSYSRMSITHYESEMYASIAPLLQGVLRIGQDGYIEVPQPVSLLIIQQDPQSQQQPGQPTLDRLILPAIEDEESKLNVNNLVGTNGKPDEFYKKTLFNLIKLLSGDQGLAQTLVDNLVPYIDKEENNGICPGTNTPYFTKDAPLDTIDELDQVCGFNAIATNLTNQEMTNFYLNFKHHISVHSEKVNFNTASPEVLYAILSVDDELLDTGLTYSEAQLVVETLREGPVDSTEKMKELVEQHTSVTWANSWSNIFSNTSQYFTIRSTGLIEITGLGLERAVRKTITSVVKRGGGAGGVFQTLYWKAE